jgi:excisionase family DNA binding protein
MDLQTKRIITAEEASEYTGYAKSYLLKLASSGIITASNPSGRKVFIEREKLEEWMLSNQKGKKQQPHG